MNASHPRRSPHVPITTPTFSSSSHAVLYRRIAYTFFALTVVVLIGVVWLSSVEATVEVRARRTPIRGETIVEITPRASGSLQLSGRVLSTPMRKTQEFQVVGVAESVPTTTSTSALLPTVPSSTKTVPPSTPVASTKFVTGKITVINKYSKPQALVERTRFVTPDGKLYRLDRRITIPAGGRVVTSVTADQAGPSYAIAPTSFTIPGLWIDLQKLIYAESTEAFTMNIPGGTVSKPVVPPTSVPATLPITTSTSSPVDRKIVTQENIDTAYESLTNQAVEQAKRVLFASMNDGRLNGAAYFVNTTNKSASVRAGQVANTFTAQVDVEVIGVFYSADSMQQLVRSRLRERLPEGQEFLSFDEKDFVYVPESVDKQSEQARLRVITNAEYRVMSNHPGLVPSAIAGQSRAEAEAHLRAIEGVESATVTLSPGWIGKVPRLTDRIHIEIK